MQSSLVFLFLLMMLGARVSAQMVIHAAGTQLHMYVAPDGNDNNSGLSPSSPLATFNGVEAKIAARRASRTCHEDILVTLASGTYYKMSEQEVHPDRLLGNSTCTSRVIFQGGSSLANDVVVSGGAPITFGTPTKIATSSSVPFFVSTAILSRQEFTQRNIWNLWKSSSSNSSDPSDAASERIPFCTSPMAYYSYFSGDDSSPANTMYLQFSNSNFPRLNMSNLGDYYVRMYHSWTSTYSKIFSLNASTEQIVLEGHLNDCNYNTAAGNRFEVINIQPSSMPAAWQEQTLLQSGSTCFTSSASADGKSFELRVFSRTNFSVASPFIAPLRATVITIGNQAPSSSLAPVAPVSFHKITFSHTDSRMDEDCPEGCSQSGAALTRAAVEVSNTAHLNFSHSRIVHTGGYAMWLHSGSISIVVEHCELTDLGAGGIRIGANAGGVSPNELVEAHDINVTDCSIHDGGKVEQAGCGVFLQRAYKVNIVHNNIFDLYYTGVSTGWTWGWAPTSNRLLNVSFNHIYEIGKSTLSDMGCIYNLGISPGTVFSNNICHDVISFGYGGWGYYADEGTSETLWTNNIAYRTKGGGFHQHYGLNNLVLNNVLAFPISNQDNNNGDRSCLRSSAPDSGYYITSFSIIRNILLIDNVNSSLYFSTNYNSFTNVTFSNNTYWSNVTSASDLICSLQRRAQSAGRPGSVGERTVTRIPSLRILSL